jgi:hypothetical protein
MMLMETETSKHERIPQQHEDSGLESTGISSSSECQL